MTARAHAFSLAVLSALAAAASPALPQEARFETAAARLVLATNGVTVSLVEAASGHDWLAPGRRPFATVRKGGKSFTATRLTGEGEAWRAEFGASGVEADFRIVARTNGVVFEVARVQGAGVEELRFAEVQVTCKERAGGWNGVWWNEQFAVGLVGLSDRVHVQLPGNGALAASVYAEFGLEGERVVLVAVPTTGFLETVQTLERDFDLPSPRLGGQWAKQSRAVRTSYLFTDLTEANAGETIRFAKLGGFEYIMTYDSTWAQSLGSYPIHTNHYPRGEAGLKATVDACHAAGLKAGLHCLTSFVGKNDPLVRPRPDARLLKDDQATLAVDIDARTNEIAATASLAGFPTEGAFYGDEKAGFDLQIDDELIQYRALGGPNTNTFLKCVRGWAGTRAAPHRAGAKIHHLVERYGSYLADLRTSLKGAISERLAGVINRCGFDMVYFDGGECNAANGPFWYWVGQQQDDVCRRVTRELLVQGSGGTAWTWHWHARGACDDFAAVAPKVYLDHHKIADSWAYYTDSFMPAELGWWGFLAHEPHHPATTPDEVEFYAVRMLALDAPVSLETHLATLRRNGRTEEMLRLLGQYEKLRLSGAVPDAVRERLRQGEWHWRRPGAGREFAPIRYEAQRADVPGELRVTNRFEPQPLRFRLQALPALAAPGAKTNLALLPPGPGLDLAPPTPGAAMPGALAWRTNFPAPLDLLRHRALAVRLVVDGRTPAPGESRAVLNVQLEAGGKTYRDHYLDLDFSGERTVVLPESTTERMLPEFRPAHANYAFKAAMYGFDYRRIVALNLRWMRQPQERPAPCRVLAVEALAEHEMPLTNPEFALGGERLLVTARLNPGDYVEFWAEGPARVFDRNGALLSTLDPVGGPLRLQAGENRLRFRCDSPAAARLTAITTGEPLSW
jgi:hypothetical protein